MGNTSRALMGPVLSIAHSFSGHALARAPSPCRERAGAALYRYSVAWYPPRNTASAPPSTPRAALPLLIRLYKGRTLSCGGLLPSPWF